MSDRTEKPTPKRREEARRKGQIARRPELAAAIGLFAGIMTLRATGTDATARAAHLFSSTFARAADTGDALNAQSAHLLFIDAARDLALLSLPVILSCLAAGVAGNFAQGGLTLTPSALAPRAERFNPIANAKRAFGLNSIVELIKSVLKISALAFVGYFACAPAVANAPSLVGLHAAQTLAAVGALAYNFSWRAAATLLLIAALDYGYGWLKHERSLRMTKQELKDEFRQQEGDPLVKNQRRRAARRLTQRRLAVEIPRADVVVTNPTHFAVALRYDRERDAAPVVVAKGADEMAKRIRKIAHAHNVMTIENPPLARALYRSVEVGRVIPTELFRAVAELLAYVYRRKQAA